MAVRPEIALAGQSPSIMQAVTGGAQLAEQIRDSGTRGAILRQQEQIGAQAIAGTQQQQALQGAQHTLNLLEGLKGLPLDQRASVVAQQMPLLTELGLNPQEIVTQDLTDTGIDNRLTALRPLVSQAQAGDRRFQFGASTRVELPTGETVLATQRRDPVSGEVSTVTSPIEGQIVSTVGETAEQRKEREISTAVEKQQQVGDVEIEQSVREEEELREARVTTAQALQEISTAAKKKEAFTSKQVARLDEAIETGLSAVSSLPDIDRGLELLQTVKTGGIAANAKSITDFFGTTSGDIGELNNILAENVLAGLSAFTGAISEGERAFIEKMNTSLSQGTGFNIAQLNRLRNIYKREVNNGLNAAKIAGDEFATQIFEESIQADPSGFAGDVAEKAQSNLDFVNGL